MAGGMVGSILPPTKKLKGEPLNLEARDPGDWMDSAFQAGILGLIMQDLIIRFGPDVWHLV